MVEVGRLVPGGGDPVDVQVEDVRGEEGQIDQAGLLPPLPQGRRPRVPLPLVVTPELEPGVKAPVVVEEDAAGRDADDEGASGHVTGDEGLPREAVGLGLDEAKDCEEVLSLFLVRRSMAKESIPQAGAARVERERHGRNLTGPPPSGIIRR